jgi:methylmalonyl-CoA mutase N-terminal domain/subunit
LPTEESARVALRTQQIIAHESGVANSVDPFGGAYAVEDLTNRIEAGARELLDRIEAAGGTLASIEAGMIQREIQDAAYRAQQKIDAGDSIVVGVNQFTTTDASTIDVLKIDPEVEREQVARVQAVRASRDGAEWEAALAEIRRAATGAANLVPTIVRAVEARATVGEISDAMRSVFGEHEEINV